MRSTPSRSAAHLELTGGLRWDRFDVDYTSIAVDGRGDVVRAHRHDDQLPRRRRSTSRGPKAASTSGGARPSTRPPKVWRSRAANVALEPEKTRNYEVGHEVGRDAAAAVGDGGAVPHREDQRAHAGREPGRSANGAGGRAARQRHRGRRLGPDPPVVDGDRQLRVHGQRRSRRRIPPPSSTRTWRSRRSTRLTLWTTFELPGGVGVGGGAQYMDTVFRNATNTASVPSYWLINAIASYTVNAHLTLRINGSNLADERVRRSHRRRPLHSRSGPAGDGHRRPSGCSAMLLQIPDVLTAEQVAHARRLLDAADWVDGRVTAGHQSAQAKDNVQIPEDHPAARAARRDDPRGAAAEPALHLGGAAAARVSAALQPLLGRSVVRQPRRQRDPARCPARRIAFAPICRPRCSSRSPTSTTAAS